MESSGYKVEPGFFDQKTISNLVRRATEVNTGSSMSMEIFIETYGMEKVKQDYSKVADRLKGFLEQRMEGSEKLGHVFEAAFLDLASRHNWFGHKSEVQKASRYDDIINGVDMITTVLDKENNARHFEIATDITMSAAGLATKFNKIKSDVYRGKLAEINYYHSDLLDFTGTLRNIPRTVIALDHKNMHQFLTHWLNEPELAQRQFAQIALQQISAQAKGFAGYAKQIHGEDSIGHRRYRNTYQVAQEMIETESNDSIQIPEDRCLESIKNMSAALSKD